MRNTDNQLHHRLLCATGYWGHVVFTTPDLKAYADGQTITVDEHRVQTYSQAPSQAVAQPSAYYPYAAYAPGYGYPHAGHYQHGEYYGMSKQGLCDGNVIVM